MSHRARLSCGGRSFSGIRRFMRIPSSPGFIGRRSRGWSIGFRRGRCCSWDSAAPGRERRRRIRLKLKARGRDVLFSAIDVSHDLVVESAQKLVAAGAGHQRSLVCDLAESDFLAEWLDRAGDLPRLITFFGLVPNLAPSVVTRLFRAILRPGDILLASAHLAPVSEGIGLPQAMQAVLPQYDNPETLVWLTAALEHGGLQGLVDAPEMKIGEIEGVPAFVAQARWKSSEPFEKGGHRFSPSREEPLRLFHSLRYTPSLFENLLRSEGFNVELLTGTSCREEAIWAARVCSGPSEAAAECQRPVAAPRARPGTAAEGEGYNSE